MIDILLLSHNQEHITQEVIKRFENNEIINKIIIFDDNSEKKYNLKLSKKTVYFRQKRSGLENRSKARNKLLELSKSQYIWFMDGDCIPKYSDPLILLQFIKLFPNSVFMGKKNYIDLKYFNSEKKFNHLEHYLKHFILEKDYFDKITWDDFYSFTFFCDRKIMLMFDEKFTGWGLEDIDLAYRWNLNKIEIYQSILFHPYHINHILYYKNHDNKQIIKNMEYMLEKYPDDINLKFYMERMKTLCIA